MRLLLIFIWTLSLIGCGSARTPLPVADPQPVEVPQPIEVAGNPQTDNRQTSGQPLQAVRLVLLKPFAFLSCAREQTRLFSLQRQCEKSCLFYSRGKGLATF